MIIAMKVLGNKKERVVKFQQSNIETKESNENQRKYYQKWKESINYQESICFSKEGIKFCRDQVNGCKLQAN